MHILRPEMCVDTWVEVDGAQCPEQHAEVHRQPILAHEPVGLLHQLVRHVLEQLPLARDQLQPLSVLLGQPPQHIGAALRAANLHSRRSERIRIADCPF